MVLQYGYRMSKVALNIAGKTLAGDLKKSRGGLVAIVHPGVVRLFQNMGKADLLDQYFPWRVMTTFKKWHSAYEQKIGKQCLLSSVCMQVNTDMLRSLRTTRGVPKEKLTANTITPEDSASKILGLIDNLSQENSGSFWAADTGKIIGW